MSEVSVSDWQGHARREAAAILAGNGVYEADYLREQQYPRLIELMAVGWLQGVEYGAHATLPEVATAIREMHEAA